MVGKNETYTMEEIEKIKGQLLAYKDVLTTLKLDTSLEDYASIKNEFEELKIQMASIDIEEDAIDDKPSEPMEQNYIQMEQVSVQLDSLNRLVEEVLSRLNTVVISEMKKEQAEQKTSPHIIEKRQHEQQENYVIIDPTYIQIKNLIDQSVQHQNSKELVECLQHTKNQRILQQQRHFTPEYFQTIDTQPTNIHNGLYRNMRLKVSSKLKNIALLRKRMNQ